MAITQIAGLDKQFSKSNGVGCVPLHERVSLGCLLKEKLKCFFCFKRILLLRETSPEQERTNVKQKGGPKQPHHTRMNKTFPIKGYHSPKLKK